MRLAIAKSVPCKHVATLALGRFVAFLFRPMLTPWHVAQRPLATYPQNNPQTYPQRMVWFLLHVRRRILCRC